MGLTFIGVPQQRAPFAGISITESLCTFVALRRWGNDSLHVVDVQFYTAEDGSGLATCPYKAEFKRHMVPYDGDFNFNLALRDFLLAHGTDRLGYSAEEVVLAADTVELVPVAVEKLAPALALLRQTAPLKDAKETTKILSHFIKAVPTDGDLAKSQDRIEPVLAVLYAIIATGVLEDNAQRASEQAAKAQAEEVAALAREARDPYYRDFRVLQRERGKEKFELILNSGIRVTTTKDGALATVRNRAGRLA